MLHLMRELLLLNLAKTLPKYAHKKVYLSMSKKGKFDNFTLVNATVHLFCRNAFFFFYNTPTSLSGYKA